MSIRTEVKSLKTGMDALQIPSAQTALHTPNEEGVSGILTTLGKEIIQSGFVPDPKNNYQVANGRGGGYVNRGRYGRVDFTPPASRKQTHVDIVHPMRSSSSPPSDPNKSSTVHLYHPPYHPQMKSVKD